MDNTHLKDKLKNFIVSLKTNLEKQENPQYSEEYIEK